MLARAPGNATSYVWQGLLLLVCLVLSSSCGVRSPTVQTSPHRTYHRVQRGQTLWSIARAYRVDVQTLARVNRLTDVDRLAVGQQLYIPGVERPREVTSKCPCTPVKTAGASTRVSSGMLSRPSSASSTSSGATLDHQTVFIWPVEGTITRVFQPRGKHRHDGIDIAAPRGAPIRAAADGEVIYSDWGPGGYGRIVILRHDTSMVTIYAHTQRNVVRVGEQVRQGERIATVGKSGRTSGYHLHFEIRRRTVPVSPFKFLPRNQRIARLERH
jgi:murein DD-endopeptidase MepM/ murein hydrolase activator NlpD